MMKKTAWGACAVAVTLMSLGGCATESSRVIAPTKVEAATALYTGRRVPVVVSKVDNRSSFMRGVFTDGPDRLGSQAKTVLISHLQQSQRFGVMDRDNMADATRVRVKRDDVAARRKQRAAKVS